MGSRRPPDDFNVAVSHTVSVRNFTGNGSWTCVPSCCLRSGCSPGPRRPPTGCSRSPSMPMISPWYADAPTDLSVTVYRAPRRDAGEMDLDGLQGFALIRETRLIRLPAGESRVRFEGVADGIEPVSAIVAGLPVGASMVKFLFK